MAGSRVSARRIASFTWNWGLQILAGAGVGLWYTVVAMPPLVKQFGPAGGALASLAGIGLGLLLAVFVTLFCRLGAATRAAKQLPPQAG